MAQIVCKYLLILVESFKVSSSWPRFIILSLCVLDSFELRKIRRKNWGAKFNNYRSSSDSYVGPSSYTSSQVNDYPGYGNFGPLMNMKNPQISSSYSSFGPSSDSSSFGSTSYVNYPPTVEHQQINPQNLFSAAFASLQAHQGNSQRAPQFTSGEYKPASSYPASSYPVNSHSASSYPTHSNSATSYQILSNPASSYQNSNSYSSQSWPHASLGHHTGTSSYGEATPISQHVEITKPVAVPVYKKFPYPVSKNFSVAIPHPVLVPVPAHFPVNVEISQPIAVPIIREIRIPIEKEILYPVIKHVIVAIEKPVSYEVEKHYPVYVNKPYPVKIPIIKTVVHKAPKKVTW